MPMQPDRDWKVLQKKELSKIAVCKPDWDLISQTAVIEEKCASAKYWLEGVNSSHIWQTFTQQTQITLPHPNPKSRHHALC